MIENKKKCGTVNFTRTLFIHGKKQKNNPLTPMCDQDRIFPYNINTVSSSQVMRMKKKKLIRGLLVDPIPNSPN